MEVVVNSAEHLATAGGRVPNDLNNVQYRLSDWLPDSVYTAEVGPNSASNGPAVAADDVRKTLWSCANPDIVLREPVAVSVSEPSKDVFKTRAFKLWLLPTKVSDSEGGYFLRPDPGRNKAFSDDFNKLLDAAVRSHLRRISIGKMGKLLAEKPDSLTYFSTIGRLGGA